jgi:uncharacterized protein
VIVVLDTNVWISALLFGGVPDTALVRALSQDQLAISSYIEDEIMRVLESKFGRDRSVSRAHLDELLAQVLVVEVTGQITGVCRDPKDDAILETAWKANADYLVAGDKDLLALKEFRGIAIIPPAVYLRLT